MKIGSKIQILRKKIHLTQSELAEKMNVSFQTVSGWERDEYLPETNRLSDLADCLGVSVSALFINETLPELQICDRLFSEDHMYTFIKATAASKGYRETACALPFAWDKHDGQFRKGEARVPYINHPLTMACHALSMNLDDNTIATCLLHDMCEDCFVDLENLPVSADVRTAVEFLTFSVFSGENKQEAKKRYFNSLSNNPIASIVKVIDRCNNLSTMAMGFSSDKMIEYILETEKYIIPLIDTIKDKWPAYYNAAFLLKYQIRSILETVKRMLR